MTAKASHYTPYPNTHNTPFYPSFCDVSPSWMRLLVCARPVARCMPFIGRRGRDKHTISDLHVGKSKCVGPSRRNRNSLVYLHCNHPMGYGVFLIQNRIRECQEVYLRVTEGNCGNVLYPHVKVSGSSTALYTT